MAEIPEAAQRARHMYADGVDTRTIMSETGLKLNELYCWTDGGPLVDGAPMLEPLPRRMLRTRKVTADDRRAMIARIMHSCDRQISEIERRINPSPTQLDQDSRRLAMISRTLNELTAIDQRNREMKQKKAPRDNDKSRIPEQPVPRDADELRRSLARKLESIIAERSPEASDDCQ